MDTKIVTCSCCNGTGKVTNYKLLSPGFAKATRDTCHACKGQGYTEYALFTVDEAKAILKHCGLSTES